MTEQYHEIDCPAAAPEERGTLREQLIGHKAERALAFQTVAVKHFGPAAGIFCRQLLFWDGKGQDPEGWIYKSAAEWEEETGLKRRGQEKARKVLVGKEVMEEKRANGPDGRWRLFYRLNLKALMELVGDDLPAAKPSISTQDCTVLSDRDPAQYYREGTMPGSSGQTVQKSTQENTQKNSSSLRAPGGELGEKGGRTETPAEPVPLSGEPTEPLSGQGLVRDLVHALEAAGHELPPGRRGKFGGVFKRLLGKGVTAEEFADIISHIVTRWPDEELLPNDALAELRGERDRGGDPASPPEVIVALKNYDNEGTTDLRQFASLASQWDFTLDERPPWKVYAQLGNTDEERNRYLPRIRSVARRAVREAREAQVAELNPANTPEDPTTSARIHSDGLEGVHEGTSHTPDAQEDDAGRALAEAVDQVVSNPESNALRLARGVVRGVTDGAGNPIDRSHVAEALRDELGLGDDACAVASTVIRHVRQQQREEVPTA